MYCVRPGEFTLNWIDVPAGMLSFVTELPTLNVAYKASAFELSGITEFLALITHLSARENPVNFPHLNTSP